MKEKERKRKKIVPKKVPAKKVLSGKRKCGQPILIEKFGTGEMRSATI